MSTGEVNPTELVASLINHKDTIVEGLRYVQDVVKGSMSILLMTSEGIYAVSYTHLADASYSYVDFNFKYPEGNSWINKGFHNYICWGGNAPGFFNLMEQAHINDELPELQGHWANEMTTDGGIYTKGDGLPDNVLDSYGKKSYKTELVDDFVTLEDERLQENDYVFSAVHVVINEFDMTANEDIGGYLFNENTEYGNWEPADLYLSLIHI